MYNVWFSLFPTIIDALQFDLLGNGYSRLIGQSCTATTIIKQIFPWLCGKKKKKEKCSTLTLEITKTKGKRVKDGFELLNLSHRPKSNNVYSVTCDLNLKYREKARHTCEKEPSVL